MKKGGGIVSNCCLPLINLIVKVNLLLLFFLLLCKQVFLFLYFDKLSLVNAVFTFLIKFVTNKKKSNLREIRKISSGQICSHLYLPPPPELIFK